MLRMSMRKSILGLSEHCSEIYPSQTTRVGKKCRIKPNTV